jgi:hypothetical protein
MLQEEESFLFKERSGEERITSKMKYRTRLNITGLKLI